MVGRDGGRLADRSRTGISQKLVLVLPTMDGAGAYLGLDQHENHFGLGILLNRHSHRNCPSIAG